jgi:hypothetical protein
MYRVCPSVGGQISELIFINKFWWNFRLGTIIKLIFFSTKLKNEVCQIAEDLVENYNFDYLTTM